MTMTRSRLRWYATTIFTALLAGNAAAQVTVQARPARVLLEPHEHSQHLNFDFLLHNRSGQDLELSAVRVRVLDADGKLVRRLFINRNGLAPSLNTLPERRLAAGDTLYLFNPFHSFDAAVPIHLLVYEFEWSGGAGPAPTVTTLNVQPVVYQAQTRLVLPLQECFLVYDGNDFYSHHRRLDITHPVARLFGLQQNAGRYAYDLAPADGQGNLFRNDGRQLEDWYGYGANVYAPAAGRVVAARNTMPDNYFRGSEVVPGQDLSPQDPVGFSGNHLVINHGNGEYSLLAHFRQGSLRVQAGDQVQQGQLLGQIGFSGSTGNIVHLHYELRNSPHPTEAEGLPSQFGNFTRLSGSHPRTVRQGTLETGELIQPN